MPRRTKDITTPFSAYNRRETTAFDEELALVGRGMPCGEYLRRFWQPVALSSELADLPVAVRIMGEDLVAFRDGDGRVGLLERYCSHRNTSLEYGKIERRGLRCCYHGWHYDIDGRILDTPGEPEESRLKERFCHGAYPTLEYKGIVFAYMGPPELRPEFPIYDLFERPHNRLRPDKEFSPCNWLQVRENETDPIHITFLHHRLFGTQFTAVLDDIPTLEWRETPVGMMYITVRRWENMLWARSNDMILPNIARVSGVEDAKGEVLFDRRGGVTNWAVPVDDTGCLTIGWWDDDEDVGRDGMNGYLDRMKRAGDRGLDPAGNMDTQTGRRSYAERQRAPGDWDAWVSQGPITPHRREHLGTTDVGVVMYRKLLRRGIRAVQAGRDPKGVVRKAKGVIPTFGHNTVKPIPPAPTPETERELRLVFGREITAQIFSGELRRQTRAMAAE